MLNAASFKAQRVFLFPKEPPLYSARHRAIRYIGTGNYTIQADVGTSPEAPTFAILDPTKELIRPCTILTHCGPHALYLVIQHKLHIPEKPHRPYKAV